MYNYSTSKEHVSQCWLIHVFHKKYIPDTAMAIAGIATVVMPNVVAAV
ncbi:hypothetical protein L195_g025519 [Trifolium pratense]|uniref:Uncharacterized protein n=1 Tax=Trifolium pratense TaxID=57577 RepID=A0A2K3NGQ8_TRIPR|nr:hypothetical protein L195_g025519 [Trifolium pratense]